MQLGRMKAIGLLLTAASALELDLDHPYDHRPALLQVGFPFTMPTGARHFPHADFMATCYNFVYAVASGQNASRADTSSYTNSLCQVGPELCQQWSDDLALAIEAKHSRKKYGMTYSHWCKNLYKRTTSKAASDKAAHVHEAKVAVKSTPASQAHKDEVVAVPAVVAAPVVPKVQAQSGVMHKVAQKAKQQGEQKAAAKAEHKKAARKHRSWFDIEMKEEDMQEKLEAEQAKRGGDEEAAARRRFFGNSASLSQQGHAPVQQKDFLLKRIVGEGRYLGDEAMSIAHSLYQRI